MLVTLLNIPRDPLEWARWSWAHRDHHTQIAQAIASQGGGQLPEYQLDPIPPGDVQSWLARNQQAHSDMNGALRAQGTDLLGVDFNDPRQSEAWFASHYKEHETASQILKI